MGEFNNLCLKSGGRIQSQCAKSPSYTWILPYMISHTFSLKLSFNTHLHNVNHSLKHWIYINIFFKTYQFLLSVCWDYVLVCLCTDDSLIIHLILSSHLGYLTAHHKHILIIVHVTINTECPCIRYTECWGTPKNLYLL